MKNLKVLFVIFVGLCVLSVDLVAQNENSKGNAEHLIIEQFEMYCMCAGEVLVGTVTKNHIANKNKEHWNIQFKEIVGKLSGEKYNFVEVINVGSVHIFRVIGKKGLVSYGQYDYRTGDVVFFCTSWR